MTKLKEMFNKDNTTIKVKEILNSDTTIGLKRVLKRAIIIMVSVVACLLLIVLSPIIIPAIVLVAQVLIFVAITYLIGRVIGHTINYFRKTPQPLVVDAPSDSASGVDYRSEIDRLKAEIDVIKNS